MKTILITFFSLLLISPAGFCQLKSNQEKVTTNISYSLPRKLYSITRCQTDSLILQERSIEFTQKSPDDVLATNPCLILKQDNKFSFFISIAVVVDTVKNQVSNQYERRVLSSHKEITGLYYFDEATALLDLTLNNGKKYRYKISTEGNKTTFMNQSPNN